MQGAQLLDEGPLDQVGIAEIAGAHPAGEGSNVRASPRGRGPA